MPQRLDELAPKHLQVPSGSRIAIDYAESPPVLAVRLQELFGLGTGDVIRVGVEAHVGVDRGEAAPLAPDLLGPAAGYITGQTVHDNGGTHMAA